MPPRKDTSIPTLSLSQTQQDAGSEGIEDMELPKLLVTQLAQTALPPDIKYNEETITALVKSTTIFINHLTLAAHEVATSRAHKTISGADVSKALETIEFPDLPNYTEQFQTELEIFRQGMKNEKHEKHERGKNKTPESKGKNKEKEPSSKVANTASQSQAILTNNVEHTVVSEANAGSSVDVDMHGFQE